MDVRRALLALLVSFAAVVAPAADAAVVTTLPTAPLAGPVLAGGGIAWAERRRDGGVRVLRAGPGPRDVVWTTGAPVREPAREAEGFSGVELSGSPDRLTVDLDGWLGEGHPTVSTNVRRSYAGPADGPLTFRSSGTPRAPRPSDAALAGLAWTEDAGGRFETPAGVAEIDAPETDDALWLSAPRLAGDRRAWLELHATPARSWLVARDETTGAQTRTLLPRDGNRLALELAADGRVLLTTLSSGVWTLGPGATRLRRLALGPGRHAARIGDGRAMAVLTARRGSPTVLRLRPSDGGPQRVIARGVRFPAQEQPFDFDGERLTFVRRSCSGFRIHVVRAVAADGTAVSTAQGLRRPPRCAP